MVPYFSHLLNESRGTKEGRGQTPNAQSQHEYGSNRDITTKEVSNALKEMGRAKVVSPDNIPIEVWRCLGEEGIQWLTNLFNVNWSTRRCPRNGGAVHLSRYIKTKAMHKCVAIIEGLNSSATQ